MCGIAGYVAPRFEPCIGRMMKALDHRGPDGEGAAPLRHNGETAGWFGHKRLAILDLTESAHQPMYTEDGRFAIVYNGEVFNFHDIRARLEQKGERFTSRSDTEVILKAFRTWGAQCLHQLHGMFAFAIWDAEHGRLFLARDRFGIKPLYYHAGKDRFFFASELRALLAAGCVPRRLSARGIHDYLRFGSLYDPDTMIEGVKALLPGHCLTLENGVLEETKYWEITADAGNSGAGAPAKLSPEKLDELRHALWTAASRRMISDVPVGIFLSGGMDSAALTGMVSSIGKEPLDTFSIVFRESDFNEAAYSRMVADRFQTRHHEIVLPQCDMLAAMPQALRAMDQPSIDGINTYMVSAAVRHAGMKVALSGLGGDEVFGGYSSFRTIPPTERFLESWRRIPGPMRSIISGSVRRLVPVNERNEKISALLQSNGNAVHPYVLSRMLFVPDRVRRLLRAPAAGANEALARRLALAAQFDPVNRVSYLELYNYTANTLLRDADCMGMAHGLEIRVPFLDHELVQLLFTIPGAQKLRWRRQKPLLVEATRRLLPDAIVHRPRRGFALPFEHWLKADLRPEIERTFLDHGGPTAGILDPKAMEEVWRDFLAGRTSWSRPWSLYVLRRWCEANL
jgi:asparagine synthase (glutamine-hydrolysing)